MKEQPSWTSKEVALLNTVLVLAQWDSKLPKLIAKLFGNPAQYSDALAKMRWGLAQAEPTQLTPLPAPSGTLTSDEWQSLYACIAGAAPLRDLFKAETDPFAGATRDQMLVLAGLSDISTDRESMFYTRDEAFMDVLSATRLKSPPTIDKIITDGLERFIYLNEANDDFVKLVYDLACSSDWQIVLASLRDLRDYTEEGASTAAQTLNKLDKALTTELRERIFGSNNVSRVPQELVRLAFEKRTLFADASSSVPQTNDPAARRKLVAAIAFLLFKRDHSSELKAIEANLQLRFDVANHLTGVRTFAKMDALLYSWPRVASLARARYKSLKYVEDCFIEGRARPSEAELRANRAEELYGLFAADRQLVRFLELRPRFGDIDENVFIGYRAMAPVSVDKSSVTDSTAAATPSVTSVVEKGPKTTPTPSLNTFTITIQKLQSTESDKSTYQVTLAGIDKDGAPLNAPTTIKLNVHSLLDDLLRIMGSTSPDNLQAFLTDFFSRPGGKSKALLQRAGIHLWESFFIQTVRDKVLKAFEGDQPIRLVIETEANELIYLPWEWLFDPTQGDPLVRLPKYSLVRSCPNLKTTSLSPLTLPLRVLALMPNPNLLPTLNFQQSVSALESALPSGKADKVLLINEQATRERLFDGLEALKPQIVHFEGHIDFLVEQIQPTGPPGETTEHLRKPYLLLKSPLTVPPLDMETLASRFLAAGVQLLVFGNNDVSSFYNNPTATMASALVQLGLPAVLTTTRGVEGSTANSFTSSFYTSLLQGATLEDAAREARTAIARTDRDWSAFALFANPSVLKNFSLPGAAS